MNLLAKIILASVFFIAFKTPVFAIGQGSVEDVMFSSDIFAPLENFRLINDIGLVLPIIVAWFAIKVARMMQGGKFEKVWKLIAAGMSVLAIVKVIDGLEDLGVLQVSGLRGILEFIMILVFFFAFLSGYRSLQIAIGGPILEKPTIAVPKEDSGEATEKTDSKGKE